MTRRPAAGPFLESCKQTNSAVENKNDGINGNDDVICADLRRNGIMLLVSDRNWLVVTVASHYKKYPPNRSALINRLQIACSQLPCVRHQPGTAQTTERAHGSECTTANADNT